jgi:hypothetical protein
MHRMNAVQPVHGPFTYFAFGDLSSPRGFPRDGAYGGVLLLRGLTCFTKFRLGWRPRRVSKRDTEAMRKSLVSEEISRISIAPISEANSLEQMIGAFEAQLIWQCVPIIRRALVSCETKLKWVRRFRQVIITVNFVSSPRYPSKVYAG